MLHRAPRFSATQYWNLLIADEHTGQRHTHSAVLGVNGEGSVAAHPPRPLNCLCPASEPAGTFMRIRRHIMHIARCLSLTGRRNAHASDGGIPEDARSFADGSQIGQTLALFSINSSSSHPTLQQTAVLNPLQYLNPRAVTCLRPRPGNGVRLPGGNPGCAASHDLTAMEGRRHVDARCGDSTHAVDGTAAVSRLCSCSLKLFH